MAVRKYLQPFEKDMLDGFDRTLTADDLRPLQRWMSSHMLNGKRCLIGAFMGSGKTGAALYSFHKLWLESNRTKGCLIIAPYHVCQDTWPEEIYTWDFARDFMFSVVMGTARERFEALNAPADIWIVNRENVRWLWDVIGDKPDWPFDVLIYDEASRLKSGRKHKRAKGKMRRTEFGAVAMLSHRFQHRWLLSGTPASEGLVDLWGPSYIVDHGERLGATKNAFLQRWFLRDSRRFTYYPTSSAKDQILERINDVFHYVEKENFVESKSMTIDRNVTLTDKIMKQYRKFRRSLVLEMHDLEVFNSAVLAGKLLQFANGSVYDHRDESLPQSAVPRALKVHGRKIKELDSIFEEASGEPMLVWYSYKFDLWAIRRKFPWVRVFGESSTDLEEWNRGQIRAMVMHPASAGHGLNFQRGGHLSCWYGLPWSLELYQQANQRLDRPGQRSSVVRMYRILAKGTMDEEVARRLALKQEVQDSILSEVASPLEEIGF